MCRLFGMSAGDRRMRATFWLLDAPDSLSAQSRRNPDGTGLGYYDDGRPVVEKQPLAAYQDNDFATEARSAESHTFVAHVRFASSGAKTIANTHPFEQDGRLLAHNGVVGGAELLDEELHDARSLVHGQTDSERVFALITREARARGGDTAGAIEAAARWIAAKLPLYALNLIVLEGRDLYALRYPATHELYVLERGAGGRGGDEPLRHRSSLSRVHADQCADHPAVVVASERMDDDPGWRALDSGELLYVRPDLSTESRIALPDAPAHPLTLADLDEHARSSQSAGQV